MQLYVLTSIGASIFRGWGIASPILPDLRRSLDRGFTNWGDGCRARAGEQSERSGRTRRLKQVASASAASRVTATRSLLKVGLWSPGKRKASGPPARRQFGNGQRVHRGIHLRLEVIDAELVKVAEDNVARAVGDEAGPVVEGLAVVALEIHAALLHFEQDDGFPDEIGKGGAAAVFAGLADAELGLAADIEDARVAERLEQPVQKDLRLTLLIAGNVLLRPAHKQIGRAHV